MHIFKTLNFLAVTIRNNIRSTGKRVNSSITLYREGFFFFLNYESHIKITAPEDVQT